MTNTLRGVGGPKKKWDVTGRRGVRVNEFSGGPIFILFIKENWICAMTRHHAEPSNIYCIVCGLNRTVERVVNLNVMWLGFILISLVHMHGAVIVSWFVYVFKLLKLNRLIAKWVLKIWTIINKRHFVIFLDNCLRV